VGKAVINSSWWTQTESGCNEAIMTESPSIANSALSIPGSAYSRLTLNALNWAVLMIALIRLSPVTDDRLGNLINSISLKWPFVHEDVLGPDSSWSPHIPHRRSSTPRKVKDIIIN
jgi:hypothetical protein